MIVKSAPWKAIVKKLSFTSPDMKVNRNLEHLYSVHTLSNGVEIARIGSWNAKSLRCYTDLFPFVVIGGNYRCAVGKYDELIAFANLLSPEDRAVFMDIVQVVRDEELVRRRTYQHQLSVIDYVDLGSQKRAKLEGIVAKADKFIEERKKNGTLV